MVESIMVSMALQILRDLLIEEAKFLSSVSGRVEEVHRELKKMHSFLKDVDRRPQLYDSNTVSNWVQELSNLARDAETMLERYKMEVLSKREGKNLKKVLKRFTCILCECVSMHGIGKEAKEIRSRMAILTQRSESMNKSGESSSNSRSDTNWLTTMVGNNKVQQHFVVMKKDIQLLKSLLTGGDNYGSNNGMISICGMGGSGKSTLAAKLYNKESVRCCFDAHAWIFISQQFQPEVIFKKMLKQLAPDQLGGEPDGEEMARKLHEVQRKKRCLVVLDDVWENEDWRSLEHAFPIEEGRGKILLTTRKDDVASIAKVHRLKLLSEDERLELLQKTALPINYNTQGESSSNSISDTDGLRGTYGLDEVQQHFVGMEEDIQLLESLLTSQDNNGVISICGMGGSGKSTLAAKLHNKESVRSCFDAHAWICVSQQFQREVIFRKLLKQLAPDRPGEEQRGEPGVEQLDEDELVRKLNEVQREKKCLVVLDDIWENEHWMSLIHAFPITGGRGKILLTTRNDRVEPMAYVHRIKQLSEDEGWELLQKTALPINYNTQGLISVSECERLENNGKEIVRKCGFKPLAISVVGGILREKKTSSEWETVKKNLETHLKQGEGMGEDERIMHILDLSYNSLPYHLTPCFLFLGCFPEDIDIDVEELFLCWMAEGMVSSEDMEKGETLRDVAKRYLREMVNRYMVIPVKVDALSDDNTPTSCRLHDLMRDLCLLMGKKEKLLEVLDTKTQNPVGRTRWMTLHKEHLRDLQFLGDSNLRSLLILGGGKLPMFATMTPTVKIRYIDFGILRSLRILILKGCAFQNGKLPREIEKLILLKHFSIEKSEVDELPPSLHKLQSLQSLNLEAYSESIKLTHCVINNLKRLRHLVLPNWDGCRIRGGRKLKLDRLSQLHRLLNFDSRLVDVADLLKLPNLQHLDGSIHDEGDLSTIVDHILGNQDQFREIQFKAFCDFFINSEGRGDSIVFRKMLMCHSLTRLEINGGLRKLPVYEPQLGQNLVQLTICGSRNEEDPMETLEKLPKLRQLLLGTDSFLGEKMVCGAGGFPQLRELALWELQSLVEWSVEEEAMPNLSSLKIMDCRRLKMLPEGLKFINTLQGLRIANMPQVFNKRMQVVDGEAGEDFDKIKHIPSVVIY